MRIVSLLPSATEIICSLGLSDQLVGVSHECDYPAEIMELPKITKDAARDQYAITFKLWLDPVPVSQ